MIFLHKAKDKHGKDSKIKANVYDDVRQMTKTKLFQFIFPVDKIMT